jgi:hypothetical protein
MKPHGELAVLPAVRLTSIPPAMNSLTKRLVVSVVALAIALPVAFAAKPDKKKKKDQAQNTATAPAVAFASADKDGDGVITQSEYVAAFKDSLGEDAAKVRFGQLDKNIDAKLSKEEYSVSPASTETKKRKKKDKV